MLLCLRKRRHSDAGAQDTEVSITTGKLYIFSSVMYVFFNYMRVHCFVYVKNKILFSVVYFLMYYVLYFAVNQLLLISEVEDYITV